MDSHQQHLGAGRDGSGFRFRPVAIAPAPPARKRSPSPPPASNPRVTYAEPEDWEAHRGTITRLYFYEEMRLKDVKQYMEEIHSFFATYVFYPVTLLSGLQAHRVRSEKMYKTRTKKWGLDKRAGHNPARVAYMVRLARDRAAEGKESAFTVHGNPVDWDDIRRYLERRPDLMAKIDGGLVEFGGASAGVVCRTPSPDPARMFSVPSPLDAERDTRMHGEVLLLFRGYMDAAFEQGMWRYNAKQKCYLGPSGSQATGRICAWASDIWAAVQQGSSPAQTVAVINGLMDHLASMIRDQDCSLFVHLVRSYYFLHQWDRTVSRTVATFVGGMCDALLGTQHPFSSAWRRVVCLEAAGLHSLLEKAALFRLEYLENHAREHKVSASSILLEEYFLARSIASQSQATEIDQLVLWILNRIEEGRDELAGDYYRLLLRLVTPQIFNGNYQLAELMLASIGSWIDGSEANDPYFLVVVAGYHFNLGLMCHEMGEEDEASRQFAEALASCTLYHGPWKHLAGHVLHWMMGYGVAEQPKKAERWRQILEAAVYRVMQDSRQGGHRQEGRAYMKLRKQSWPQAINHELVAQLDNLSVDDESAYRKPYQYRGSLTVDQMTPPLSPFSSSPPFP